MGRVSKKIASSLNQSPAKRSHTRRHTYILHTFTYWQLCNWVRCVHVNFAINITSACVCVCVCACVRTTEKFAKRQKLKLYILTYVNRKLPAMCSGHRSGANGTGNLGARIRAQSKALSYTVFARIPVILTNCFDREVNSRINMHTYTWPTLSLTHTHAY